MNIVKKFWRLFRSLESPPLVLRRIELQASPDYPNATRTRWLNHFNQLECTVDRYTPYKIYTELDNDPDPVLNIAIWLPSATIDAIVRVVEGETDGTTRA